MLTRIEIDGFKSFTNFSMEFSPLTIIAGLNASGKSNLFDALHLLSLLAEHDLNTAFDKVQRGSNLELFTQYADGRHAEEMRFAVEIEVEPKVDDGSEENTLLFKKLRYELSLQRNALEAGVSVIEIAHEAFAPVGFDLTKFVQPYSRVAKKARVGLPKKRINIPFAYRFPKDWDFHYVTGDPVDGKASVWSLSKQHLVRPFSVLQLVMGRGEFPHFVATQKEIRSWKLLHLDPKKLTAATPAQAFGLPGTLNASADNLAGVLWRLEKTDPYLLTRIAQRLASLVPGIKEFKVNNNEYSGVYEVWVLTTNGQRFPLRLLSEGTLRMLALCTLAFDDQQHGVLGLEEPENGVHPGLLKRVAELLFDLSNNAQDEGEEPWPLRQVIVNTHSPGLIKACLEAAAGQEGSGKSELTVWFSQLVSRPVEEDGKRVMRRVTDMLPVVLPRIQPSEAVTAELSESERRVSLAQLLRYLDTTAADPLLHDLGLTTEPATPRD